MMIIGMLLGLLFLATGLYVAVMALAGVVQAATFLLEPGGLYLRYSMKAQPEIRLYRRQDFLSVAQRVISPSIEILKQEGFEEQESLWAEGSTEAWSYITVMWHPSTRDRALVKASLTERDSLCVRDSFVELRRELADGRCVRTLTSTELSPFGAEPYATETTIDKNLGPRAAWQAHRIICAQQSASAREEDASEDAVSYLQRLAQEERAHWKERGLVVLDEQRDVLKLTYKGACLMSWGRLWPVSKVRRSRMQGVASRRLSPGIVSAYDFRTLKS